MLRRTLQYIWASPNTAIGLILTGLALLSRGRARVVDGVVESHGGLITWMLRHHPTMKGGVAAMTLGHVVIGLDEHRLARTRFHERVHVAQYERWGPFFLPAYGLSSAACFFQRKNPYRDNMFEKEAFAREAEHRARLI